MMLLLVFIYFHRLRGKTQGFMLDNLLLSAEKIDFFCSAVEYMFLCNLSLKTCLRSVI